MYGDCSSLAYTTVQPRENPLTSQSFRFVIRKMKTERALPLRLVMKIEIIIRM